MCPQTYPSEGDRCDYDPTGEMSARTFHFKLVLLGDSAVGKSCLVVRFVRDEFFEFQEPTIGGRYPFPVVVHGVRRVTFQPIKYTERICNEFF